VSGDDSKFELSPAGIAVFIAFVVLSAAYILMPRAWLDPQLDPSSLEPDVPEILGVSSLEEQQDELGADYAFELPSAAGVRVFIYEVSDDNYSAYAFRLEGSRYTQLPPSVHPTGFEPPFLSGEPPELSMRETHLGVLFVFSVEDGELIFALSEVRNRGIYIGEEIEL
jgi:hypothetical protein